MYLKIKLLLVVALFFGIKSYAQNLEIDAIKFGTNNNTGTARFIAVGGSMSAIGADISNISYNPAGIAMYNSSVVIVSPSYEVNKSDAVYKISSRQRMKDKLYFSNLGAAFAMKSKKYGIVKSVNIGFAMNSLNKFNSKNEIKIFNKNSITQNWINEANYVNGDKELDFNYDKFSFETVGAYNTWLVNFDTTKSSYYSPIHNDITHRNITETKGGKTDAAVSMGVNLNHKVFLGVSVAFPSINYTSTTTITEKDNQKSNGSFQEFSLNQEYNNKGSGLNVKFGVIYKPISFLRLSAAIQTQTEYSLTEEYTSDFKTVFDTATFENESSLGTYKYELLTPWRANFGLAFVHKKFGFISLDYEIVDYSSTKFNFDNDNIDAQDQLNNSIKKKYEIAHNVKIGLEKKINKLKLRVGYALQTSPLKKEYREGINDFSRHQFSGGIGYIYKRFSFDAAYRYSMSKEFELSYDGVNGIYKNTDNQLYVLSVGFKISK